MDKLSTLYESVLTTEKGPGDVYKQGLFKGSTSQNVVFGKHRLVSGHNIVKIPYQDAIDRAFVSTPTQTTLNELIANGFKFTEVVFYSTLASYKWAMSNAIKVGTLFYGTDKAGTEIVYKRSYDAIEEARIYTKEKAFLVRQYLSNLRSGGIEKSTFTDKEILAWLVRPYYAATNIPSVEGVDWTFENGVLNILTPCSMEFGTKAKPIVRIGTKNVPLRSQIPYKIGKYKGYLRIGKYVTDLSNMPDSIEGGTKTLRGKQNDPEENFIGGSLSFKARVSSLAGSPLKTINGDITIDFFDLKTPFTGIEFTCQGFPQVSGNVSFQLNEGVLKNLIGLPPVSGNLTIHEYAENDQYKLSNISLEGLPTVGGSLHLWFLLKKGELKKAAVGDKVAGTISVLAPDIQGNYSASIKINKYLFTNQKPI